MKAVGLVLGEQVRPLGMVPDTLTVLEILARLRGKWPLLPLSHVTLDGVPILATGTCTVTGARAGAPASTPASPLASDSVGPLASDRAGQPRGKPTETPKQRKRRQAYAERHRQHWIQKDDAKRQDGGP